MRALNLGAGLAAAALGLVLACTGAAQPTTLTSPPPPLVVHEPPPPPIHTPPPGLYNLERGAIHGRRQRILTYAEVNPDCSLAGNPVILVAVAPAHGQITIEHGDVFVTYANDNPRAGCATRPVAGQIVSYTSAPDFVGEDTAELEIIGSFGTITRYKYHITVR
jgi:hypothetical protein